MTFTCKAKGYPDPDIQWFINGIKVEGKTGVVNTSHRDIYIFINGIKVEGKVKVLVEGTQF